MIHARSEDPRVVDHPHIAAIYGLEESGGVSALVMELVEGGSGAANRARRNPD